VIWQLVVLKTKAKQKRIAVRSSTSNHLLIYDRLSNESYVNLMFNFNILCKMASEIFRNPLSEQLSLNQLMALGPVQPVNIDRKSTTVLVAGRLKCLRFQDKWYEGRPWLEYSIVAVQLRTLQLVGCQLLLKLLI
jgi:hypothetical protein